MQNKYHILPTGEIVYPWLPEQRADLSLRARIFRLAGLNPKAAAELAVKERLADGCSLHDIKALYQHTFQRNRYLKE